MRLITATLVMLVASLALAAPPVAKINGERSVNAPGFVRLDSKGSVHDVGELVWLTSDPGVLAIEGKDDSLTLIKLDSAPATVTVILLALGSDPNVQSGVSVAKDTFQVKFAGGPAPPTPTPTPPTPVPVPPNPGPGPTPIPGPGLPDGRYKLARTMYDQAMALPPASRAKSPDVAKVFGSVGDDLVSGKVSDKYSAAVAVTAGLNPLVGSDPAWQKARDNMLKAVQAFEIQDKMPLPADMGAGFLEIRDGLLAVPVSPTTQR